VTAPLRHEAGAVAVILTPRNAVAVVGFTWEELGPILAEAKVSVGRVGRRPFALLDDVVRALAGKRCLPWTSDDTRAELASAGRSR
jgi:hypothetical protein